MFIGLLVSCGLAMSWKPGSGEFWLLFVSSCLLSLALAAYAASAAVVPVRIKAADRARDIVRLRFKNREYARKLAESLDKLEEHI